DAAIARAAKVLRDGVNADPQSDPGRALIYDEEFDEKARFAGWRREIEATDPLPATLAAAIGLEAWRAIAPLEHRDWLGAQLVADLLRHRGKARAHLPALNIGLRAIPRQKRRAATLPGRINANLEAIAAAARQGLEEHDRLTLAKAALERRCRDCRRNARLPALAEFALSRPLVTAPMIAAALKISQRAAQDMAPALGLREITGRSRFRAWAV
ncbi:MAG: DUF1612 domain-containing protein, partial [Alphaproteobacteria bacterium]|nr:DUF1612 domain-containing protein [Alphaproteobacteria bacterium]